MIRVGSKAIRDTCAERHEQDQVKNEEDFSNYLKDSKTLWLLVKKRCESAGTHRTLEPRPRKVV